MKSQIIQAIIEQNMTCSEIASKLGASRQYVSNIAKQIGVKPPRKQARAPYQRKTQPDPMRDQRRKYNGQKRKAAERGIEFLLTFDEWWELWEPHYHNMGRTKGKMCMCRTLDIGPYAVGNVRIDYVDSNGHERIAARIAKRGTNWMSPHTPKAGGMHLPNELMICQSEEVEEDPFVYYAELVTSHVCTKRD